MFAFRTRFEPTAVCGPSSSRRLETRRCPLNHASLVGEALVRRYPCVIPFCIFSVLEVCIVVTSFDRSSHFMGCQNGGVANTGTRTLDTSKTEKFFVQTPFRGLFGMVIASLTFVLGATVDYSR